MKKKLKNMHLKERIDYGYKMVITMMLVSGLISIAVIGVLFSDMMHYVNKVNTADQAVDAILNECTPALNKVVEIVDQMGEQWKDAGDGFIHV